MADAETRLEEVRWCEGRLHALVDADQLNEADYMRIANVLQAYHKVLCHQLKRKREDPNEDENWANVRHAMDPFDKPCATRSGRGPRPRRRWRSSTPPRPRSSRRKSEESSI